MSTEIAARTAGLITFDEWKIRFNNGEQVDSMRLQEVKLLRGLVYGRVHIRGEAASLHYQQFFVDAMGAWLVRLWSTRVLAAQLTRLALLARW